jgi:hypothetical protein
LVRPAFCRPAISIIPEKIDDEKKKLKMAYRAAVMPGRAA